MFGGIFHAIINANSIVQHVIQIKNGIMCNVRVKSMASTKRIMIVILACIYKNSRYLKSISDDSVIVCDGIINVTDSVSKNVTSTIPTSVTNTIPLNVMCTVPINSHNKKLRYKYGLLYFTHVFSSDHITCYNRYYLLSLHKK